jgi:carboxymethylenebutenolidase
MGPQNAQWIKVDAANGRKLLTAVFRPAGSGPFPPVVFLHGASGLLAVLLDKSDAIAQGGFVVVTGCWQFDPGRASARGQSVDCSEAPVFSDVLADSSLAPVRALLSAARTLPGVRADRVGLLGGSRGGWAALRTAAQQDVTLQAVAAEAPQHILPADRFPSAPNTLDVIDGVRAPILLLHGNSDADAPVERTREYQQRAQALGKTVEVFYYEGQSHDSLLFADVQADASRREVAFFKEHLSGPTIKT